MLDRYPKHQTSFFLKLLLLTEARKNEVFLASWDQFDLKKAVWVKPSHITKQKKKEYLPLSEKAIQLLLNLKELSKTDSHYLFPRKIPGEPIRDIRGFWYKALRETGLEVIRIHDLRHTHDSHLVSSGLSLCIVGKLLGHTQASTTQRYAHLADEPLRQAAELLGSKVSQQAIREN